MRDLLYTINLYTTGNTYKIPINLLQNIQFDSLIKEMLEYSVCNNRLVWNVTTHINTYIFD